MDEARFDRFTKALGRQTSRRAAARGGAGGILALLAGRNAASQAAAAPGSVPLGGACFKDRQCDRAACADNGFAYDGPSNCCLYDGGQCRLDEHCCGNLLCLSGICTDINTLGDLTDDILPTPGGFGSLGLGEPCGDPSQCYSGSGLEATCADNGIDFGGICCTFYGFGCASDRHCCGSLRCLGNICTVPYE